MRVANGLGGENLAVLTITHCKESSPVLTVPTAIKGSASPSLAIRGAFVAKGPAGRTPAH